VGRAYRREESGKDEKYGQKRRLGQQKKREKGKRKARQKSEDNTFAKFKWLFLLKDTMPAQSPRYLSP
jgi:hypothetical protein